MNKQTFLSSLQFVQPAEHSLTQPVATITQQDQGTSKEIKLEHHVLSIEPSSWEDATSGTSSAHFPRLGPAYFSKLQSRDPALCQVELILSTEAQPISSLSGVGSPIRTNKLGANMALSPIQQQRQNGPKLILNIDNACYQVDLNQLNDVTLNIDSTERKGRDGTTAKKNRRHPPSLVLAFPCCAFRFFTLSQDIDRTEATSKLKSIANKLEPMLQSRPQEAAHGYYLPSPAVGHSSLEPGQEASFCELNLTTNLGTINPDLQQATESQESCDSVIELNFKARQDSHADFQSFRRLLGTDMSSQFSSSNMTTSINDGKNTSKSHIASVLDSVANNLTAAYATPKSVIQEAQKYDKKKDRAFTEIESLLGKFFPAPRPKKKSRSAPSSAGSQPISLAQARVASLDCIHSAEDLMRQYKDSIRSRYSTSLLPTR